MPGIGHSRTSKRLASIELMKAAQIDGALALALAMACARVESRPEPMRLVAWV